MNPAKSSMIKTSTFFHSSINITYDFENIGKIQNFIPTNESIRFINESIQCTQFTDNPYRSKILIGAYGKGKSSIVLEAISILYNNPQNRRSLEIATEKIQAKDPRAAANIRQYINSGKRLLPIIINGNSSSLSQSFLYALHSTLKKNDFKNLMPETHFEAAARTIEKWEREFPDTLKKFNMLASSKANKFKADLRNFSSTCLKEFEGLYPQLTSGSEFNPFAGFNVVDIYEKVVQKLVASKKYNGIIIVYDEFGKYLESNISHASINDIKLLQDFAERADRSGKNQLHLVLICHKEIENYIDILPKQKVDGWKGVSERFQHIHLHNNYSEIYGLIEAAIIKDKEKWNLFRNQHEAEFKVLKAEWFGKQSTLFSNEPTTTQGSILYGAYPLHPTTTYILPRLSEKVAQNERTLFTFLSGNEKNCLTSLIRSSIGFEERFSTFTPDILFDYFENQLQNEPYTSDIKKHYLKASSILRKLDRNSLEAKLVKTISLIYTLNQFERLRPDTNSLFAIYRDAGYKQEDIRQSFQNLIEKTGGIYLNNHNNLIQLKAYSEIPVEHLIHETMEKRRRTVCPVQILNEFNTNRYIYPTSYNVKNSITRYFQFLFSSGKEFFTQNVAANFQKELCKNLHTADGSIFAIFNEEKNTSLQKTKKDFLALSRKFPNRIFILSKFPEDFSEKLRKFDAVATLQNNLHLTGEENSSLAEEYEIIFRDLYEVIRQIVNSYIRPEYNQAIYISDGEEKRLYKKSDFSELISEKCTNIFSDTPIINNEMLNKNELTGIAHKSRLKLINAVLDSTSGNLELEGSGQEISFMRSTLVVPEILDERSERKIFNFAPKTENIPNDKKFKNLFSTIQKFCESSKVETSFSKLIDILVNPKNHIGLRRGVIPIYLATVLSEFKQNATIKKDGTEVPVNAETLCDISESPEQFTIKIEKWNEDRAEYIHSTETLFADFILEDEKKKNDFAYLVNAILRWYRSLPKYTKQAKKIFQASTGNKPIPSGFLKFSNLLQQGGLGAQETLFEKIPQAFGETECNSNTFDKLHQAKQFLDDRQNNLISSLIQETELVFNKKASLQKSLKNLIAEFCKKLDSQVESHVFENGAHKLLDLYRAVSNDEIATIQNMALLLTGLNIDDWSDETISIFFNRLQELNTTLLQFKNASQSAATPNSKSSLAGYTVQFLRRNETVSKSFQKVECSVRAKSLEEEIWRTIEEMGQSVTDAEKRQVLVSLLEKLC